MAESDYKSTKDVSKEIDSEFQAAWDELKKRCDAAPQIELKEEELLSGFPGLKRPVVYLPAGNEKRGITLYDKNKITSFLKKPFEKFEFIADYDAIWNRSDGIIEVRISYLNFQGSWLLGKQEILFKVASHRNDGIELQIIQSTDIMKTISPLTITPQYSLRIKNVNVTGHDDARELLLRLSNSFFFKIDLRYGATLNLNKTSPPIFERIQFDFPTDNMKFPSSEYDANPVSLYLYAGSAGRMPLLMFLAYYQVIEYYFPTYSQAEAKLKIENIINRPEYWSNPKSDLKSLSKVIQESKNEKEQMKTTLKECIDPDDLHDFLISDDDRKEHFTNDQELTGEPLPMKESKEEILKAVADRIYTIRCKIVHTKSDYEQTEAESIMPFSKAAGQLRFDIELARYLAQQVLIKASTPLSV